MSKIAVRALTFLDFTIFLPINIIVIFVRSIRFTIKEKWDVLFCISLFFKALHEWTRTGSNRLKTGILERSSDV